MLNKLVSIFKKTDKTQALSQEDEQRILEKGKDSERLALASRADARPEVLYYLAEDKNADVRSAIARNEATPIQADKILTGDSDDDVRTELARKIGRMMPDLASHEKSAVRDMALEIMETLARDALPRVRAVLAEEIKASATVPKHIVSALAKDIEDIVSVPVLEYSPLLGDVDLREIIAAGASSRALSAIAKRPNLPADISDDISTTLDIPAVSTLLTNESAQIREDTLDAIMVQAENVAALHKPLALRPSLSLRAMKRIAGFVASALVHDMVTRNKIDPADGDEILAKAREKLEEEQIGDDDDRQLKAAAMELHQRGALDDAAIMDQINQGQRHLCIQSLSVLTELGDDVVRDVMKSKSGRAVTALCWRAGLRMRTAYAMQTKIALVPPSQLLAGKDGDDYPMSGDELDWHLSYFADN